MPNLILLKSPSGGTPGESIPLDGDQLIIGRDADNCQIVIPHHAVSRRHAQITRISGQYFIEDLKSRNHTFLNSKEVSSRLALKAEDKIKICDFLFRFTDERVRSSPTPLTAKPLPEWMTKEEVEEEEADGMTTIEATGTPIDAKHFLDVQPTERLRVLLDISTSLARTLELLPLLDELAQKLLETFRQADRCFVILLDDAGRPIPKVVKTRRPGAEEARFSRTIVKKAIDSLQSYLSEDASSDPKLPLNASVAEFKIRSVMCVPMVSADGKALGALQLDTQDRMKKFREDDLSLLSIVANLAAVSVDKAKLHETVLSREKERREVELARAVQLGFLPQSLPEIEEYEFYSHYSPAQSIGGDYYDYINFPDGRVAVVLGDVAGKGVAAALLVAKLSSEVRYCLLSLPDPAKAIGLLNDQMIRGGMGDRFVTLAVVVIDPRNHKFTVVNAGHMNPRHFIATTDQVVDAISNDETGLPIGVIPGYEYESVTKELQVGDIIAIYTDGITDAMAPSGAMFGSERADKCLTSSDSVDVSISGRPKQIGHRLIQSVRRHAAGRPQNDDIALVCFGRVEVENDPVSNAPRTGIIA